jgi:heptaprenylglyceryl phosphate synthase
VGEAIVIAGSDNSEIVGMLRYVCEQIRDLDPGVPIFLERSP